MAQIISREIRLKRLAKGVPQENDFELSQVSVSPPKESEMLVQNIYLSVDPYMRGQVNDPSIVGKTLVGGCIGQVLESNSKKYQVGDYVLSGQDPRLSLAERPSLLDYVSNMQGWREYYTTDGVGLQKIEPGKAPIHAYLGTLGMPGEAAYYGLLKIGLPKKGDTVFVSSASGAVGAIVSQIAKIIGCRVVGSAGSDEKVSWLMDQVGIDVAFNYKKEDLDAQLKKGCPGGIDIYFDNVGGKHLEAAIANMNTFGRIVLCGSISQYNAPTPSSAPNNLGLAVGKRLTLKGFFVFDHRDELGNFYNDMEKWIDEGKIKWKETIVEGIENAPKAFIGLFKGENFGKMLVKVGPDPQV